MISRLCCLSVKPSVTNGRLPCIRTGVAVFVRRLGKLRKEGFRFEVS